MKHLTYEQALTCSPDRLKFERPTHLKMPRDMARLTASAYLILGDIANRKAHLRLETNIELAMSEKYPFLKGVVS